MLLLYPPVAKPSEPPAGIAQLAGALLSHNHPCTIVDLNLEGTLHILSRARSGNDTWTKRAYKNLRSNIKSIRSTELYTHSSKYQKTVLELNRLIETQGESSITASLANYQDSSLSPIQSDDLLHIALSPEKSLFYSFFLERIPTLLKDHSPDHIGISINYLSQALSSFALIGCIKKLAPDVKIIVGGGLITSWMSSPMWRNPFRGLIDYCINGCGEKPLLQLLGIERQHPALPRYDELPCSEYFSPGFILPFSSSTGCFWNKCNFCPERAEGNSFTIKTIDTIHYQIENLKRKNSPILLHFLDNAIPPAVLDYLTENPPGLPWYGFIRISEQLLDCDYCIALKNSGCTMLKLGVESGDQDVLDRLEKGLKINIVSKVLKNLKKAGIATYVYLLFGTPAETYERAKKTLEFTLNHHQEIGFLNLAIFNMPTNSSVSGELATLDFYDGDLSLYTNFDHPQGWNRKEVRMFLDREFKKQPQIAAILRRDPVIFTSNHAPFFCDNWKNINS